MWDSYKIKLALKDNIIKFDIKKNINIKNIVIDSNNSTKDSLFIAVKGEKNDGHNYLKESFKNGATLAIIDNIDNKFKDYECFIIVKDTKKALKDLAIYSRSIFGGKIIGITGSVGKTSIKEMLKKVLLSQNNKIFASYGNFNNHYGLPLSLCNLPSDYHYGIFEMGMSHGGEIEYLSKIAKPDVAIISNVSSAHIGNFNNEEEIALAKSEIFLGFEKDGYAILNKDNKYYNFLESKALEIIHNKLNIITFGENKDSNISLINIKKIDSKTNIHIKINGKPYHFSINSINEVQINNSLAVMAILLALKEPIFSYLDAFKSLEVVEGRGNIINITKDTNKLTIIDDSYNSNLASMVAGLRFLEELKKREKKSRAVAIIGDMLELGKNEVTEHERIAKYIDYYNIDKVILVGNLTKNIARLLPKNKLIYSYETSKLLSKDISKIVENNDVLLIKGSNSMKMDLVVKALTT